MVWMANQCFVLPGISDVEGVAAKGDVVDTEGVGTLEVTLKDGGTTVLDTELKSCLSVSTL